MISALQGARVLVTGGSGLLGSHLCEALVDAGAAEVRVLDNFLRGRRSNLEAAEAKGTIRLTEGSITDAALVSKLIDGVDYVCHLAALRVPRCTQEPEACVEVMVRGTHLLLQAAAKAGVRKVLYASSVVVYGDPEYQPLDERHPLNSTALYGAAKIAGEQFCRAYHRSHGLPYVVLRYFNLYGPRMSLEGDTEVMIKWLDKLEHGEAPVVHGDGSAAIDWVHVRDAVRASMLALDSPLDGEVLNVASGRAATLKELLELLIELTGSQVSPRYEAPPNAFTGISRIGGTEKAKRLLQFETQISLREGLQELTAWYRQVKRAAAVRA
jgi:UDP-glucose 4-epimerase